MKALSHPSPNFGQRPMAPDTVIIHYTGMVSAAASLERLCDPGAEVSAHFLIDEAGTQYSLVDPDMRAWHAGVSQWAGRDNANDWSLGIELQNKGHEHGYHPFPDAQINSLLSLLGDLASRYDIPPTRYLGHSDIAPDRKQDPGEKFPWARLASEGFGVWPKTEPHSVTSPFDQAQENPEAWLLDQSVDEMAPFTAIGYRSTQALDKRSIVAAFQRHWAPSTVTGVITRETFARARQVAAMFDNSETGRSNG